MTNREQAAVHSRVNRALVLLVAMAAVQVLVVGHWWFWPGNALLRGVAMAAGLAMAAAAVASVLLLLRLLRLNPGVPFEGAALAEYGQVSPAWAAGLALSAAFGAVAWRQGVGWVVAVVAVWMAAEVAALLVARLKAPR